MSESKYNNGKIYKIYSDNGDNIYIGSTIKKYLSDRMAVHRFEYKQDKHHKCNSSLLFSEYGIENCKICLIESYPCKNSDELRMRERYYIETLKNVNIMIPYKTIEEKKEVKVLNNKKIINCICGCSISSGHYSRHLKSKKHLTQ
jgi:hypothetical protein